MCILSSVELLNELQTYTKFFIVIFIPVFEIPYPSIKEINYFLPLKPL